MSRLVEAVHDLKLSDKIRIQSLGPAVLADESFLGCQSFVADGFCLIATGNAGCCLYAGTSIAGN